MARIELYVDPICPFAWVTAGWLLDNASGEHTVALRQMSLAVLNEDQPADADHAPMMARSRRLGRMFAAAAKQYGDATFTPLYLALGTRIHPPDAATGDNAAAAAALTAAGLEPALLTALDDPTFDAPVAEAHERSQAALGGRGGSPIITVDGRGFSGPVLTAPPAADRAAPLMQALVTAATTPEFAALQRPYQGPPAFTTPANDR
ncbi:mycothiol-dependent nitroreductase Rv2466c family protein [Nocardia sp. NPDC003345]